MKNLSLSKPGTRAHNFLEADDNMIKNNYKYTQEKKITNINFF